MKVIFLSTCYPRKNNSASGIFIHRQAKALQSLGVEVHVMQPVNWFPPFGLHRLHPYWQLGYNELNQMHKNVEGIPVHHPRMFIKMPSRFFWMDGWERMGKTVGQYINRNKNLKNADWIYAHFLCHEGYAGTFASRLTGIPLASIARGDDVHAWPEQHTSLIKNLRIVFNEAKLLLANSQRLADDTKKWFEEGFTKDVEVVYNGVDLDKFEPVESEIEKLSLQQKFNLPNGYKFVVCVATPVKLKGWLELLDAIQSLKEIFIGWKLIMVAPPRIENDALDLMKEAKTREVADNVILLSSVNNLYMPDLLKAVDLFVLPSYNEGMSNSVLEALATGLPVITTNVGGHAEIIENNVSGMLIAPRSTQALLQSLQFLLGNEDQRNMIASRARSSIAAIGTYADNASRLKSKFLNVS